MYQDQLITMYDDAAFQAAFRAYFAELGCRVTNWAGLFDEMTASGDRTWLRRDDAGRVVGFIQLAETEMKDWFFTAKCGFIREFWIDPSWRRQGHGSALLRLAEESLREAGCGYALLTSDTAPEFYLAHGYQQHAWIRAVNESAVFGKALL